MSASHLLKNFIVDSNLCTFKLSIIMKVFFKSIAIQSINIFMKEMNTSELLFHAKYVTNQSQFEFTATIKDLIL